MQPLSEKNHVNNSNSRLGTRGFYYGWVVLGACFFVLAITQGARYSFGVFFKSIEDSFDITRALTSGIFSVNMVLVSVFAILGGWALDRYGPKALFVTLGLFTGLSLFLTSQVDTFWHLFITYGLLGAIGVGPVFTAANVIVSRWFIKRRGLAVGIVNVGSAVGLIVISPIVALLIPSYGWQTSYLILAVAAFFIMIPCALLLRKAPTKMYSPQDKRSRIGTNSTFEEEYQNQLRGFSVLQAAKVGSFWLMIAAYFLVSFCIHIIVTHIVPHAMDLGANPIRAAMILSIISGTSIPGRILMGSISDRIGRKQVMLTCALLMVGAMLWLIWASNIWMLYIFAAIFGFSWVGVTTPFLALIADVFGLRHLGVIMPVTTTGWGIGAAAGSALAGYIFDINGNYILAFIIGLIAVLITAVLILFVRTPIDKTGSEATL